MSVWRRQRHKHVFNLVAVLILIERGNEPQRRAALNCTQLLQCILQSSSRIVVFDY